MSDSELKHDLLDVFDEEERTGAHPVIDRLAKLYYDQHQRIWDHPDTLMKLAEEVAQLEPEQRLQEFMEAKGLTNEEEAMELFLDEKEKELEEEHFDGNSIPRDFFHLNVEDNVEDDTTQNSSSSSNKGLDIMKDILSLFGIASLVYMGYHCWTEKTKKSQPYSTVHRTEM